MKFLTIQTTGKEVLHLGAQRSSSNVWPPEYWKSQAGRWRLFTPGIDAYLNDALAGRSFGTSVECFGFDLVVIDFRSWGLNAMKSLAVHPSFSPMKRTVRSGAQIDWRDVQLLTPTEQLHAYRGAAMTAIRRASEAKRKPREFAFADFSAFIEEALQRAKISQVSRSAFNARQASSGLES